MDWWIQQVVAIPSGIISSLIAAYIFSKLLDGKEEKEGSDVIVNAQTKIIIKRRRRFYSLGLGIIMYFVTIALFNSCLIGTYDKQTYWPPPEIGDIYTVIDRKSSETICVAIEWGEWKNKERLNLSNYRGLVLHLSHQGNDSVALTVKAKEAIVRIPKQGTPPGEWNDLQYKRVSW